MTFAISSPARISDMTALDALLVEYYTLMLGKLVAAGGPTHYTPDDLMASFRPNVHKYLPRDGRFVLLHDAKNHLVGCCTLNKVRSDAGELKRLYVRPEANGHRLGQQMVQTQIDAARAMGWRHILINVLKGNQDMLRLTAKMGFHSIDRYPECADPVELASFFVYMRYDLN